LVSDPATHHMMLSDRWAPECPFELVRLTRDSFNPPDTKLTTLLRRVSWPRNRVRRIEFEQRCCPFSDRSKNNSVSSTHIDLGRGGREVSGHPHLREFGIRRETPRRAPISRGIGIQIRYARLASIGLPDRLAPARVWRSFGVRMSRRWSSSCLPQACEVLANFIGEGLRVRCPPPWRR